jgi:hypothetical protein
MKKGRFPSIPIAVLLGVFGIAACSTAVGRSELEISKGWLMQDVARVKQPGEAISTVGFTPRIYQIKPYIPPPNRCGRDGCAPDTLLAKRKSCGIFRGRECRLFIISILCVSA